MKYLYVWTGVLTDWTDGVAVALADTKEDAIKVIAADMDMDVDWTRMKMAQGSLQVLSTTRKTPFAVHRYGGS